MIPNSPLSNIFPLQTIGIRFPKHQGAIELIEKSGKAILATSANIANEPPAIEPGMLSIFEGKVAAILDEGVTTYRKSSTVISLYPEIKLLREGAIPKSEIEAVINLSL